MSGQNYSAGCIKVKSHAIIVIVGAMKTTILAAIVVGPVISRLQLVMM